MNPQSKPTPVVSDAVPLQYNNWQGNIASSPTEPVVSDDELREHYALQKQILDICTRSDDTGGYFAISDSELDKLTQLVTSYASKREIEFLETLLPGMTPIEYSLWVRTQICERLDALKKQEDSHE